MEAFYVAARGNLRRLLQLYPTWTRAQLAQATGMSLGWVDKWKKRLKGAPATDEQVLHGLCRAPHHRPPRLEQEVVDRLLEIRDEPPEGRGRTPGPKAILYYLPRDEHLQQAGFRLPRSTRTIHRLLREHGRIVARQPHAPDPIERPKPMQHWQLDFKDASTVPADPQGKQQHVVETLNIIDKGTSVLIASTVRSDFTAETALQAVSQTFQQHGLPSSITLDRDPRWLGAPQGSDFPTALLRFCHVLGVAVVVCDPHHPQPAWLCRTLSSHLSTGVPLPTSSHHVGAGARGDQCLCRALQLAASPSRHFVWQPSPPSCLSRIAHLNAGSRCGQCRWLALLGRWGACRTSGEAPRVREGGFMHLLRL